MFFLFPFIFNRFFLSLLFCALSSFSLWVLFLLCVLSLLFQFFVEARNGGLGLRLESGGLGLRLPISVGLGFAVGKVVVWA
jgi:hypothetical protein